LPPDLEEVSIEVLEAERLIASEAAKLEALSVPEVDTSSIISPDEINLDETTEKSSDDDLEECD